MNQPTQTVDCKRCAKQAPALAKPPYPGEVGQELIDNICQDCWAEWLKAEVMIINELRLNFIDPRSQQILVGHMKEFLLLAPPSEKGLPLPPEEPPTEPPAD